MSHRPDQPEDDPILDAVRDCVMAVGVRRTTLTDVARRAGVSRMTVYRRYPDVATLLQALMTREFLGVLAAAASHAQDRPTARERFVAGVMEGADGLAEHPLFRRILDVDPELMLPYVVQRYGAFQHAVLETLAAQLRAVDDGSVRDADPELLAATVELALRGWVVSSLADVPRVRRSAVRDELAHLLEEGLKP